MHRASADRGNKLKTNSLLSHSVTEAGQSSCKSEIFQQPASGRRAHKRSRKEPSQVVFKLPILKLKAQTKNRRRSLRRPWLRKSSYSCSELRRSIEPTNDGFRISLDRPLRQRRIVFVSGHRAYQCVICSWESQYGRVLQGSSIDALQNRAALSAESTFLWSAPNSTSLGYERAATSQSDRRSAQHAKWPASVAEQSFSAESAYTGTMAVSLPRSTLRPQRSSSSSSPARGA